MAASAMQEVTDDLILWSADHGEQERALLKNTGALNDKPIQMPANGWRTAVKCLSQMQVLIFFFVLKEHIIRPVDLLHMVSEGRSARFGNV